MSQTLGRVILAALLVVCVNGLASAEVVVNVSIPINMTVTNSCLGDTLSLTGQLHVLVIQKETKEGLEITTHNQPQGVSGTALASGAKYQGTGVTKRTVIMTPPPPPTPPVLITYVNNFRMIGQGSAPNYMVHQNIHITVNANGETTAEVNNLKISCN